MDEKFTRLTPELYAYLVAHRSERDPILTALAGDRPPRRRQPDADRRQSRARS